jgi:hypothetical protein
VSEHPPLPRRATDRQAAVRAANRVRAGQLVTTNRTAMPRNTARDRSLHPAESPPQPEQSDGQRDRDNKEERSIEQHGESLARVGQPTASPRRVISPSLFRDYVCSVGGSPNPKVAPRVAFVLLRRQSFELRLQAGRVPHRARPPQARRTMRITHSSAAGLLRTRSPCSQPRDCEQRHKSPKSIPRRECDPDPGASPGFFTRTFCTSGSSNLHVPSAK